MEFNSLDFCLNVKTIITLNEALEKIKQLKNTYYFRRESEKVALPDSVGREISEDIIAQAGETVFHRVAIRPGKPCAVGIMNDTPVFALPGKPTGAFTALEIVVRRYFTDMPEKGFEYILFMKTEILEKVNW
ncbi:hypothetical protein METP3_01077 [Methanosarcinales archaeon]|nr:hypothetical protein METP3_01077 [Methanosarcinales archaeon]